MADRTTKLLLALIALLLLAILMHPMLTLPRAQAQGVAHPPAQAPSSPVAICATASCVYVLSGNRLSTYTVDALYTPAQVANLNRNVKLNLITSRIIVSDNARP